MPYYAVFVGRVPGIYMSWSSAKQNVTNYPNAKYKSYSMKSDAMDALDNYGLDIPQNKKSPLNKKSSPLNKDRLVDLIDKYYLSESINFSELCIYTDGSVRNNGKKYATGSYGVFYSDPSILPLSQEIKRSDGIITTPISELIGIIEALKNIGTRTYEKIYLYTDSEYCYKALTKWYTGWVKNGWKTSGRTGAKSDVKNKLEIMEAYSLCLHYSVELHHINSHTGKQGKHFIGNEIADLLTKCY